MVICLERGADLHVAQLMPLPHTDSCFSKIQIGFTFLVPAHPVSPRQRAVKRVCVCARSSEIFSANLNLASFTVFCHGMCISYRACSCKNSYNSWTAVWESFCGL